MKFIACIIALLIILCSNTGIAAIPTIKYNFNYVNKTITLEFIGTETGITNLILPSEQFGNKHLYKQLANFQIEGAQLQPTQHPYIKALIHFPNAAIKISYNILLTETTLPNNINQARAPILQGSYFHFIGATLFAIPQLEQSNKMHFIITSTIPEKWSFASSFGINDAMKPKEGSLEELINSLFIGGDFRITLKKIKGKNIWLAMRGSWAFTDYALETNLLKIIELERNFWHDHNDPFFLVSIIPIYQQSDVISGLGLTNAFSLFIAENQPLNSNLKRLLIHEYFHTWNNPKLFTTNPKKQMEFLWFTEGFTDYYTDVLAIRAGFITLQEYLANYNKTLFEYYTSTNINITNHKIKYNFWHNYDTNKIPYQRGYILAHNWNTEIKLENRFKYPTSLDNAMLDIVAMHNNLTNKKNNFTTNVDRKETLELLDIANLVNKYLPYNSYNDIEKYILNGETLQPNPQALGKCVQVNNISINLVEPGFDLKTSAMLGIITKVRPISTAYTAGLRDNQTLVNIEYDPIDINKQIIVHIKDADYNKIIKFYGNKHIAITVPQFILDQSMVAKEPVSCLQWFGKIQGPLY